MSDFEMPKFEVPAAFRDLAERNIAQAREGYEKLKSAAEESTELMERTFATTNKGWADYNLKLIESARANINALFDLYASLVTVKTVSQAVELSTAHARQQFDIVSAQAKDLSNLAQKVAADAGEPLKEGVSKAFKLVA
jgi:phasin